MIYSNAFVLSLISLAASGRKLNQDENLGYVGTSDKDYKDISELLIDHFGDHLDHDEFIN